MSVRLLWLLLGLATALVFCWGCGPLSADGGGSVYLGPCEIIVGGDLGTLPAARGGPDPLEADGMGAMCDVATW